jgi:hypothetical protein
MASDELATLKAVACYLQDQWYDCPPSRDQIAMTSTLNTLSCGRKDSRTSKYATVISSADAKDSASSSLGLARTESWTQAKSVTI